MSIKFEKWKDVLSNDCMKKVYIMQRALFAKVLRALCWVTEDYTWNPLISFPAQDIWYGFMLKLEEKKNQHYSKHTHHLQTAQARVIVEYGVARAGLMWEMAKKSRPKNWFGE